MSKASPKKRVTIKDIARAAGVDPSTVTRALGGSTRVKKSTRELIENLAEDFGYVPSAIARSLVNRRSHLVGVVIPDMTNPFFSALMRGIEQEATSHKLRVLLRSTDGDPGAERDAIGLFRSLNVDGLIVPMARCPQSYYEKLDESIPVIHVNRPGAPYHVSCDMSSAPLRLMKHLIELGHRRIAFVNGPAGPAQEPKRQAYDRALAQADIEPDESLIFQFDGTSDSVRAIATQLFDLEDRPTAIFAWNDVCAIGLIHLMHERGVRVPEDLSIAGHDNIDMAALVQPTLTTVHWPMYEIGARSVHYLMEVRGEEATKQIEIPEPDLIVRGSTGPA